MRQVRVVRVRDDVRGEKEGNGKKTKKHLSVAAKPKVPSNKMEQAPGLGNPTTLFSLP